MVVFLLPALYVWHMPTPVELAALGAVAVLGIANQVCFITACRVGEMTVVAPLDYTRLLFAGILGYVAFGEIPDEMAVLGALIIVASGFFLRRSAVVRRAEKLETHQKRSIRNGAISIGGVRPATRSAKIRPVIEEPVSPEWP